MKVPGSGTGQGGMKDQDYRDSHTDPDIAQVIFAGKNGKPLERVTLRAQLVERADLGTIDIPPFDGKGEIERDVPIEGWTFEVASGNQRKRIAIGRVRRSLHEKANMRKWWEVLTGETLTEGQEVGEWDDWLEPAVGRTCLMELRRMVSGTGKVYAKVTTLMPLPEGMEPLAWLETVLPDPEDSVPF